MAVKTLRFGDLFLYAAATALSIRWISVAAAAGPASLVFWIESHPALLGAPQPGDGRADRRTLAKAGSMPGPTQAFGPFWGFQSGWIYWACNLPFFAGLLVFTVNLLAAALGPWGKPILAEPWLFIGLTVALGAIVGALHYVGLGAGKWLSNAGGAANFLLLLVLCVCAAALVAGRGSATPFTPVSFVPRFEPTARSCGRRPCLPSAAPRRSPSCATT